MIKLTTQISRRMRRFLGGTYPSREPIFQRINIGYCRSQYLVRFYYLASAFISYSIIPEIHTADQSGAWDFLWPVRWLPMLRMAHAPEWLAVALFLASLLAFQFPNYRVARFVFATLCLFVVAITNSQGGINHGYHFWLWIGVCFIFLPNARSQDAVSRDFKMAYLSVIVAAQALILFFYTLAGFWKVRSGLLSLYHGLEGNFAPDGLALQLADRVLQTGTKPLLSDLAISNYWAIWPIFMVLMYFQLAAVFTVLRPRLHMVWAYLLISFHLGTWLLMEIQFSPHVLWLGLLFAMSPFRPRKCSLREVLADFPGFDILIRLAWWLRAVIVYSKDTQLPRWSSQAAEQ
jgi:hypothetical protein